MSAKDRATSPFGFRDASRVDLGDDVHPGTPDRDVAGTVVVEAEQQPAGRVEHQPSAAFFAGKPLVEVLELVSQRLVRSKKRLGIGRKWHPDEPVGKAKQPADLRRADREEMLLNLVVAGVQGFLSQASRLSGVVRAALLGFRKFSARLQAKFAPTTFDLPQRRGVIPDLLNGIAGGDGRVVSL